MDSAFSVTLPVHQMQPGDSFEVNVSTRVVPTEASASSGFRPPVQPSSGQDPTQMDCDDAPTESRSHISPARSFGAQAPSSSQSPEQTFRRRVYLYRVGQPVVIKLLRWPLAEVLIDIAQALAVPPVDVVMPHPLKVKPQGELAHESSFIVQMHHDVALGAQDVLLLFDAVDVALRQVCHGDYIQIIVPPPVTPTVSVLEAVQIVEDLGLVTPGRREFAAHYPAWSPASVAPSPGPSPGVDGVPSLPTDGVADKILGQQWHWSSDFAVVVHHANDDQLQAPPDFSRSVGPLPFVPPPQQGHLPAFHDLPSFLLSFGVTFEDLAEEKFEQQGPVIQVVTWYIDHLRHPQCLRPRVVELDADPTSWPATLCAPWSDLLDLAAPLAFREVRPTPLRHSHERRAAHVILEQALDQPRYASVFSIPVQGLHHDGMLHKAVSVPEAVSAEDLLDLAGLRDRCQVYRCSAWSGIMQFDPRVREQIFSGISIKLHVHGPKFRHQLFDFGDQPFWHQSSSTSAASSSTAPRLPQHVQAFEPSSEDPHFDGLFRPDLMTAWHQYLAQAHQPPYVFRVITWFCDHVRLPRSNDARVVVLPTCLEAGSE
eukprot:s2039_g16.t1